MDHPMGLPFLWFRNRGAHRDTRGRNRVATRWLDVMALRFGGRMRSCRGVFPCHDRLACRGVPQSKLALRTFWWGMRQVPVRGGTGVCGFPTSRCVRSLRWFFLWALDLVESPISII
ncbi:hypothetical protein Taro_013915 [Colocasia esculenta]|uniref:Uncharacterized protein n=1 Tax=Colocasia esculenta TaxID=4460 RepID=A0A843U7R4_COLES|nr:hypothetical protein [Colocasia esculenta]